MVVVSDEVGCTLKRAATGRFLSFLSPEEKRVDTLVANWFTAETEDMFLWHPARTEFEDALRNAPISTGDLLAYRGRLFPHSPITDSLEFGPPPDPVSGHGRYNRAGRPVLYLATTVSGVVAELSRYRREGSHLFCQSFSLDLRVLKVADFTQDDCSPVLSITFDYSEFERDSKKYFKSQVLAEIVESGGFNGMLVPGVRGSKENRYHNLVLFEACEYWREWLNQEQLPQYVAE